MIQQNNSSEKLIGARIYGSALILAIFLVVCGYIAYGFSEIKIFPNNFAFLLWSLGILAILLAPSTLLLATSIIISKKEKKIGYSGLLSFIVLVIILLYYSLLH